MIIFEDKQAVVFQSVLFKVLSTVIFTEDAVIVVDPAMLPHEVNEIRALVDERIADRELIVIFTHGDFDHIVGYPEFKDAMKIGSLGMDKHANKREKVQLINDFDNEYYIDRLGEREYPEFDEVIDHDGQTYQVGSTKLTFYLAPGHTSDGLFTVLESHGIWVAGDYLSDFELPFLNDRSIAYKNTLEKAKEILASYNIRLMIPGHGSHTTDQKEILKRIHMAEKYIYALEEAIINKDMDKIAELGKQHPYPSSFTKSCHEENVKVIRHEVKKPNDN